MKDPNKEIMVKKLYNLVDEINVIVDTYNNKHAEICQMIDEIATNGLQTSGYVGQGRINHIKVNSPKEIVTY